MSATIVYCYTRTLLLIVLQTLLLLLTMLLSAAAAVATGYDQYSVLHAKVILLSLLMLPMI